MNSGLSRLATLLLAVLTTASTCGKELIPSGSGGSANAKLCRYENSATSVSGRGGAVQLPLTIGKESCTVSVTPSGWVENAVTTTAEAGSSLVFGFMALGNLGPERRTAEVVLTGTKSGRTQTITLTQDNGDWLAAENSALPARFVFNSTTTKKSSESWKQLGYMRSYMGAGDRNRTGGYISLVRADGNAASEVSRTVASDTFLAAALGEGDCWLFTLPGVNCTAGAAFDFYASICGNAGSPKYYIFEYYDNGCWKCDESLLYTAEEDPQLRYSLMTSGTGTTSSAQYTTFDQSFSVSEAHVNSCVYMRLRAVGKYAADGSVLDVTKTDNTQAGFTKGQFVGANISALGGAKPEKKLRVLCIGNSFSYYYYTASQLKQLAWSQGLELEINAFFKGGQTFQQQLALPHSAYTVDLGGYDYAFLQDQSQNPARYAQDSDANVAVNESCMELARRIRAASPDCRIIVEDTWAYPASSCGGFGTLEEFDRLMAEGSLAMARNAGAAVSPIGQAFAKVRAERPEIILLYSDDKHPAVNGSYLKSCVNCLILTGKAFEPGAACCDTDAATAEYLRKVAESVVLGHESEYLIER